MAELDWTFPDVAVPGERRASEPKFESGPKTSSSIRGSGYDDQRWNSIGKFVREPGCRETRASMESSLLRCVEAESTAVRSARRPPRKKRIVAIFRARRQRPKPDIAPACVAAPSVHREHPPGWELRTRYRGRCG